MSIYIPAWVFLLPPSMAILYIAIGITNGFSYGWPFAQAKTDSLTARGSGKATLVRFSFLLLACTLYVALGWIWYYWVGVFQASAAWMLGIAILSGDVGRFIRN